MSKIVNEYNLQSFTFAGVKIVISKTTTTIQFTLKDKIKIKRESSS